MQESNTLHVNPDVYQDYIEIINILKEIESNADQIKIAALLAAVKEKINQVPDEVYPPLLIAASSGHLKVVELAIAAGANLNHSYKGYTPLYLAAQNGHTEVVKILIAGKADVNQAIPQGVTPLLIATRCNQVDVVKYLIAAKANVDQSTHKFKNTPLIIAAKTGHLEILHLLIAAKANIYLTDTGGNTALFVAIQNNKIKTCEKLLEMGGGMFTDIPKLPDGTNTENKVVIGMKINGELVSRKTPGFEKAITNLTELKQAIKNKISFDRKALISACDHLSLGKSIKIIKQLKTVLTYYLSPTSLKNDCLNYLNRAEAYSIRLKALTNKIVIPTELKDQLNPENEQDSFAATLLSYFRRN